MPESIRVVIQTRPLLPVELASNSSNALDTPHTRSITIHARVTQTFTCFDTVYPPVDAPPTPLYTEHVEPLVSSLFHGFNATVFAYGQTAAGKSFTMTHITSLAARQIFQNIPADAVVRIGFVEIYKEHIRDLVDGASAPLGRVNVHVRERLQNGKRHVFLDGARERCVSNVDDLMDIIREGALVRCTAATKMNASSSRSHSIITITVQQENASGCKVGKLHLVDLAGSERAKKTAAKNERFAEGVDINRGLLALAKVISSLSTREKHIPYRDSKLTRLLQDSLGGNAKTLLIACVSPASSCAEETLGTLRYAQRAKNIINKPTVNTEIHSVEISDLRANLARAKAEISTLVKENERLRRAAAAGQSPYRGRFSISPGKNDALIVTRDDVIGLRFRIKELEELLEQARRETKVGLDCLNENGAKGKLEAKRARPLQARSLDTELREASEEVARHRQPPQIRHRLPHRAARRVRIDPTPSIMGRVKQSVDLTPPSLQAFAMGEGTRQRVAKAALRASTPPTSPSASSESGSEADSEQSDDMEACMVDVRSATKMDEMRRTFTARLRQSESDKKTIDDDRVKLMRRLAVIENNHQKELEVLKSSHAAKISEMRQKLSQVNKLEAESTRLNKLKDGSDAARKRLQTRVRSVEKERDNAMLQLSNAVIHTENVRKNLGKENKELIKHERQLRTEMTKLQSCKRKLEAVVNRLRMENEVMRGKLRDLGRHNVRRANSGFVGRVGTRVNS